MEDDYIQTICFGLRLLFLLRVFIALYRLSPFSFALERLRNRYLIKGEHFFPFSSSAE
jgi:hypothetical protein